MGDTIMAERPVILVVEDDQDIQNIVGDALDEGGFEFEFTDSGEAAVTLLKGSTERYRALVIDIALRGRMSGWEVGTRARQIDPEFPVVYISGVYADQWTLRGVPNSLILTNPFAPEQLLTAVSGLLKAH